MRRLVLAAIVVLALPASAQGKGLMGLTLCGDSGKCESVRTHESPVQYTTKGLPAPPVGSYYLLHFGIDDHIDVTQANYYEPVSGLVAFRSGPAGWMKWHRLDPAVAAKVEKLARRLDPFPATVTEVKIGKRVVREGAKPYLRLVELRGPYVLGRGTAVVIRFASPAPNPWTTGSILYYPANDVLLNGPASSVRVPANVAAELEGRAPGGGFTLPWIAIGTGLAGAFGLALLARRRAPEGEVAPVH